MKNEAVRAPSHFKKYTEEVLIFWEGGLLYFVAKGVAKNNFLQNHTPTGDNYEIYNYSFDQIKKGIHEQKDQRFSFKTA